jgi:hypothetical protein
MSRPPSIHPFEVPPAESGHHPPAYCHIYGQVGQAGDRIPGILQGLTRRGIPADIDFDLAASPQVLSASIEWQRQGNLVAPNIYPPALDPACTNSNWWSYSEEECGRLLGILRGKLQEMGLERTDAVNTYTPGNAFIRAATKLGFRHLTGFCAPTCINDGHWQITHTGAPLAPFFPGGEDYRKPGTPPIDGGLLISSMELRNPFTCLENWVEGPFCPLNLLMGDRSIETGEWPLETIALCEDFIRLGELTGSPRFFHINLQYFTSAKCFDLNERMLDWLKIQEQCGRLKFIGLRDYGTLLRKCGGVLPQTTWWRGECMGQHVGGQRGEGNEAIVCEDHSGQWQFRRGQAGPERYFDYRRTWDYPPFHPRAELPASEGYACRVTRIEFEEAAIDCVTIKFSVGAVPGGGIRRFCLWDVLLEVGGPFTLIRLSDGLLAAEVVPHPGGSGAALLLDANLSAPFTGEVVIRHSGHRENDHSRNWEDLVVAETIWLHGQPVTRMAATVPYPLDLKVSLQSRSPVRAEWILGNDFGSEVVPGSGTWTGKLDGTRSASMVRFFGVNAAQLEIGHQHRADLRRQAVHQTASLAGAGAVTIPDGEILRYGAEAGLPAWLHQAARNGADREIAQANEIAVRLAGAGRIVVAIHMAADLPVGSKGRVRSAFFDRVERTGGAELFAIYYDYGQTYLPGVSGWNQFWRVNLGVRGLPEEKSYDVILNAYDPEGRMTTLRMTANATNAQGETVDSPEIVLVNPFLAAQGLENRFDGKAFIKVTVPREARGSDSVNLNIYSNGEQTRYDRLTERRGFVFLSHAWLVEK